MADYNINREQVSAAAAVLRDLLRTEIPEGDFTEGSVLSDFLIDGHAVIVGYLNAQIAQLRDLQSLRTLQNLPASEAVDDAVDAILDNFFRTRDQGRFAKGVATLHFSQRLDLLIPRTTRFFKTTNLVYYIDSDTDLIIPATDLRSNLNADGTVIDYTVTVFLTAARSGPAYNVAPGRFVAVDRFNAFLTFVENISRFSGGIGVQSTADFINRSTNAIALRALINARSNDAVLLENFPNIEGTLTIGYGDSEMTRDTVANVANSVTLHVGGHMDIFVRQPVQEVVERLEINQLAPRNDERVILLRDTTPPAGSFVAAGIVPGDILVLGAGIPEAPFQYTITAVRDTELEVSLRTPFSIATDELVVPVPLSYTIGNVYPSFNNKANVVASITANTTRRFAEFNRVILPAVPTFLIKKIELFGAPPALLPYADPLTTSVFFTVRKNGPSFAAPPSGQGLPYYVEIKNPGESQSDRAVALIELGWRTIDLTGATVEVTYETQTDYTSVSEYVDNRFNRPGCANSLARAFHPIYLYGSIPYRQRSTPTDPLQTVIPIFNAAEAQLLLQEYLNNYREPEPIDVSLIATKARETSNAIASIYSFAITYEFLLPNGQVLLFQTQDKITIFPDGVTSTAKLLNPLDFGFPATGYEQALQRLLRDFGVTDRVTRYIVTDGALVFEERA